MLLLSKELNELELLDRANHKHTAQDWEKYPFLQSFQRFYRAYWKAFHHYKMFLQSKTIWYG